MFPRNGNLFEFCDKGGLNLYTCKGLILTPAGYKDSSGGSAGGLIINIGEGLVLATFENKDWL